MSGFECPNYTQTPNDLFDLIPELGDAELKVLMVIIRETFGYHRTTRRMSVRNLAKLSGLTVRNAFNGAEKAIERGLIYKKQDGGVTVWGVIVRDTGVSLRDTPSIKESIKERIKHPNPAANAAREELKSLSDYFSEITSLEFREPKTKPDYAKNNRLWWTPLKTIMDLCNGNSRDVIRTAVEKMRRDNLTIASPASIEKVALAMWAEQRPKFEREMSDPFAALTMMESKNE